MSVGVATQAPAAAAAGAIGQQSGGNSGEGLRRYLELKVEQLQRTIAEKTQNKQRLEAQRNELNARGEF